MNDDRLYTQDDLKEIMAAAAEGAARTLVEFTGRRLRLRSATIATPTAPAIRAGAAQEDRG